MNKELEVLKNLKEDHLQFIKEKYSIVDVLKSILVKESKYRFIERALKRNEPMKPKVAWKNEEDKNIVGYRCLNCNGSLGAKLDNKPMFPNFCRHCGQKLDWSDEK